MTSVATGTVIGGVRIERTLGRGGMGTVYLGQQVALNRWVAVKVVREDLADEEEFRARFRREAEVAASLDHPHIVPVHSAGEEDGRLYVVMRYLEGTDLGTTLRQSGALAPDVAARIVDQIAGALDAAHTRGLVHRDVKPANIMLVGRQGSTQAFLTDFGLSKAMDGHTSFTAAGEVLGTVDYMAPEQFAGTNVDGRVDVYALGCVLYETLTGAVPFPGETGPSRMYAHFHQPPPRASERRPEVPAAMDAVVGRAMAKSPADRFTWAGELGSAAMRAAGTVPAPPPDPWSSGPTVMTPQHVPPPVPPRYVDTGAGTRWDQPSGGMPTHDPGRPPAGGGRSSSGAGTSGGRRPRRPWIVAAAIALVVVLAAAVALVVVLRGDPAGTVAGAPIPVGNEPYVMEEGGGYVWVGNSRDGTITRIDPATGATRPIAVGGTPYDLTVEGGSVWVDNYSGELTVVDIATEAISGVPVPPGQIVDIEHGDGYVWVTGASPDTVLRINAATRAVDTIPVAGTPGAMAFGNHVLYAVTSAPPSMVSIDAATAVVLGRPLPLAREPGGLDVVDGTIYIGLGGVPNAAGDSSFSFASIDERSLVVGAPTDATGATWVEFAEGSAWAAYPFSDEIRRVSLADRTPEGDPIPGVGKGVASMRAIGDQLWVLNADDRAITRIDMS